MTKASLLKENEGNMQRQAEISGWESRREHPGGVARPFSEPRAPCLTSVAAQVLFQPLSQPAPLFISVYLGLFSVPCDQNSLGSSRCLGSGHLQIQMPIGTCKSNGEKSPLMAKSVSRNLFYKPSSASARPTALAPCEAVTGSGGYGDLSEMH